MKSRLMTGLLPVCLSFDNNIRNPVRKAMEARRRVR